MSVDTADLTPNERQPTEAKATADDLLTFIAGLSETDDAQNALDLLIEPVSRLCELVLADELGTEVD